MFHVGDTVVKPSIGICKIKAIRRLEIENRTEDYYVVQSGEVDVLIPRKLADQGALRLPMDETRVEKLRKQIEAPFRPLGFTEEGDLPPEYQLKPTEVKAMLKRRDPEELVELIRVLFNKQNDFSLDKKETDYLSEAMSMVVEEIAYLEKTTKGRVKTHLNKLLSAGRKEGRRLASEED